MESTIVRRIEDGKEFRLKRVTFLYAEAVLDNGEELLLATGTYVVVTKVVSKRNP